MFSMLGESDLVESFVFGLGRIMIFLTGMNDIWR